MTKDSLPQTNRPKWRKWLWRFTAPLLAFLLFIVLLWAGLQTRWAKDRLAELIVSLTGGSSTYRVHMEGIRGVLPFSILLDQMSLSDEQGVWIEGGKTNISLNPWALFKGRLEANWIRMDRLELTRLPSSGDASDNVHENKDEAGLTFIPRVMVHEMHVKRIELAKAIAGKPLVYSLNSRIETLERGIEGRLILKNLQRSDDILRVKGTYDLRSGRVAAQLTYQEARGGVVSGLTRMEHVKGIRLEGQANGPLSNVEGFLNLEAAGYGKAVFNYQAALPGTIRLALDGRVEAEKHVLPPQVAAVLGGLGADITCRATLSSKKMLQIEAFTARAPAATISLDGKADLKKETVNVQIIADPVNVSPFIKQMGIQYQDLGPVRFTANGPFSQPALSLSATLRKIRSQDSTFERVSLEARAIPSTKLKGLDRLEASLLAQHMSVPQARNLRGPLRLKILAKSPDLITWELPRLHLTAKDLDVNVKHAFIDTREGRFSATANANIQRLLLLMPPGAGGIDGTLKTHIRTTGNYLTPQMAVDLSGTLSNLNGLPTVAVETIGPEMNLNAHLNLENGTLKFQQARINTAGADLKANGQIHTRNGTFDLDYHLNLNALPKIGDTPDLRWAGTATSQGTLKGDANDFNADIRLNSRHLQINGWVIQALNTRVIAKGLPRHPHGTLNLKGTALKQPLALKTHLDWAGDTLTLSQAQAKLPGMILKANLNIVPGKRRISGSANGEVTSFAFLNAMTGVEARGSGTFRLQTEGDGKEMDTRLNARFRNLQYDDYRIGSLNVETLLHDMDTLKGRLTIDAEDIDLWAARLEQLKLRARGNLHNAHLSLDSRGVTSLTGLDGSGDTPVALSTLLQVQHTDMWRFRVDRLKASYKNLNITLPHPATITVDGERMIMDDVTLNTAHGRLHAKGGLGHGHVNLSARIDQMPLAFLEPIINHQLTGTATVKVDLSGPLSDPLVDVGIHIRDHRLPGTEGKKPLMLGAEMNARRQKDRFEVNAELSGLGDAPFTAHASIPAHLSLKPLAFYLDEREALQAKLQGHVDLKILSAFPGMDDQNVSGQVDVDLGVTGPIKQWALTGGITLAQGGYENVGMGMILKDIQARIQARDRSLFLTEFSATDGAKGTLSLKGDINMTPPFPVTARLSLNKAVLLRKELLTTTTSGTLEAQGDKDRLKLTGDITLDRTELTLPRRLPPDVVEIPVQEINLPEGMTQGEPQGPSEALKFLSTDVTVKIPARFFVRGHNLDAEFKGQINIKGPANQPVVRGTLSVVRGTYQFLARTFHITEGQIAFDGSTPPTPFLNVIAEVNAGEINAQVRITGPTNDFKLSLSSHPPLPQDEIMANILFGQSAAKLNPFQAYQLASALAQLSGQDLPDVMGKTRQLLGVDRLNISGGNGDDDQDSGPSVEAGKYVSDNVYVGVEQDLTDAKQDVVVEVDITPNFSVKSKAGTKSGAGLGFSWKYDY